MRSSSRTFAPSPDYASVRMHQMTIRVALAAAVLPAVFACSPTPAPAPAPSPTQGPAGSQPAPTRAPAEQQAPGGGQDSTQRGGPAAEANPRPYGRVVTAQARSRDGLFKTHRVGSRVLFEIPRRAMNKDMLLVTRIARTALGAGYGGQQAGQNDILRWERRDNRVLVRMISYDISADSTSPIYQAVLNSNNAPILASFNVEAYGPDSSAVVDVTRLFSSPPAEIGAGPSFRGTPDATRSYIERVLAFPDNVEVEATVTYPAPPTGGPQAPPNPFAPTVAALSSVVLHWSMVKLPEQPMKARLADKRVGYFTVATIDYSRPEQRSQQRQYIRRYRLEKKDPGAAISEPVKPIVYYVDPATPDWLKPYIRKGIEAWKPAFEAAGFRNGIVARDAPTPSQDPDWSPEDARYSVIRWFPSTIENAQGPNVVDPRSGEILEADVYMYHNIMTLQRSWYFTQVGHLDPRASLNPYPDSLMGRLVEYVVAHEVGHTLGFPHNMKASATYPVDSVRSRTFVRRMGHTPTLMDYSRFNYTAQPEDSIALRDLIPGVGPYDLFATMWGYAPIPGARTPDDERPTLDQWARRQDREPWLRYMTSGSNGADPADHTEAVGDADPVLATEWGLRNIKRLAPMVLRASVKEGEDYEDLAMLYGRLIGQWATELRHVANVVGGAETQEKYYGQQGVRFTPISRARQQAAVRFLNENAFRTPTFFLQEDILRRIEVEGAMDRIGRAQLGILTTLFNDTRMARMIEFEALRNGTAAYSLGDMLGDVRRGIFSELAGGNVEIDPFRRHLQRRFLELMDTKLNPPRTPAAGQGGGGGFGGPPAPPRLASDARALMRGELLDLDAAVRGSLARASDRTTRLHLQDRTPL